MPATIRYGQTFRILTASAGSIAKVSLIRLARVTHAFDENGTDVPSVAELVKIY